METFSIEYALLAAQIALLDVITPELRAVVVDICKNKEDNTFLLYFYYDGKVSEKMIDLWQCAATETSANLGADFFLHETIERLAYPKAIPLQGKFAYLRKESSPLSISSTIIPINKEIVNFHEIIGSFESPVDGEKYETTLGISPQKENRSYIIPGKPEKFTISITPTVYALLSIQRALLGKVVPALRMVTVELSNEEKLLYIRFYYDGEVALEIIYLWELAIAEVFADCGPDYALNYEIQRLDMPKKMPMRGRMAYERKEEVD